jgi:hypothetical protein
VDPLCKYQYLYMRIVTLDLQTVIIWFLLIVGLDATTKGPSPLVGESKVSCSENYYFVFICVLHTNNQSFFGSN